MASGANTQIHTQTHTYQRANQNNFKKPGARGLRSCTPGLKTIRLEVEASDTIENVKTKIHYRMCFKFAIKSNFTFINLLALPRKPRDFQFSPHYFELQHMKVCHKCGEYVQIL